MEREDHPYGEPPTQTEAAGQIVDPATVQHDFKVGDRVKLNHDYTFGDRSYPAGWAGQITELDVTTYGATEGVMETLGARVRFDEDPTESAAWAPYSLLEHEDAD
jgi:threonine dehydrogenase-like Zn-dependent dehydrogenase